MNMLTNKVPFGLLSEEDQELFVGANCVLYNFDLNDWVGCSSRYENMVYRLKLKESEWYRYNDDVIQYKDEKFYNASGSIAYYLNEFMKSMDKHDFFCPATQEEIDSVKPKETFVDREITWKSTEANVIPPFNKDNRYDLSDFHIGVPRGGWVLSKYIYASKDLGDNTLDVPILFSNDGTEVEFKATHARFVRVK